MNSIFSLTRLLTAASLGILLLLASGCETTPKGQNPVTYYNTAPLTVAIPSGLSPQVVENECALTLTGRSWNIIKRDSTSVTATLNHRGYDSTVTLKQQNGLVLILLDSSTKTSPKGRTSAEVPERWLRYLQQDLNQRLIYRATRGG